MTRRQKRTDLAETRPTARSSTGVVYWVDPSTGNAVACSPDVDVDAMAIPVECTCGDVVDLAAVHVTARYADCSMFKMPCCGRQADDRRGIHQPYRRLRP